MEISLGLGLLDQVDGRILRSLEIPDLAQLKPGAPVSLPGVQPPADPENACPAALAEAGLDLSHGLVLTLKNDVDGATIQRDVNLRIDVQNFQSVFGGTREWGARAIQRRVIRRMQMR